MRGGRNKRSRRRQRGRERSREEGKGKGNGVGRAHLEGREVRGGRRLLQELRGGVEKPRPTAHLRVAPTSAAAAATDAGHHRRTRRRVFARGFEGGGFRRGARAVGFCLFGEAVERSAEMAPGLIWAGLGHAHRL